MALLRRKVLVAEDYLRLAPVDGKIMVIQLIQAWGAESCRICGTQTEIAWGIHQCGFWCEMLAEGFMMCETYAEGGGEVSEELCLMLRIGCEGIDILMDIA